MRVIAARTPTAIASALFALSFFGSRQVEGQSLSPVADELVAAVRIQERKLETLAIEGTWLVRSFRPEANDFGPLGVQRFHALFETIPGGRMRLERNTPATGAAPGEANGMRYVLGYDGRVGVYVQESAGLETDEPVTVTVDHKVPDEGVAWGHTATYWKTTVFGFGAEHGFRYSEMLVDLLERMPGKSAIVAREGPHGRLVEVVMGDDASRRTITHDPAHGYGISAMRTEGHGILRVAYEVLEWSEVLPGVYYPRVATRKSFANRDRPREEGRFEATRLVANSVADPETAYSVTIPRGVLVEDRVSDVTVYSGYGSKELRAKLAEEVALAKRVARVEDDAAVPILAETPRTAPPVDRALAPGGRRLAGIALLAASGLAGLVMLSGRLRGRRRRAVSAGGAVLACWLLSGGSAAAQDAPLGFAELPAFRAHNCGLNVCGFALEYFGRPFDPESSARELDIGARFDRPASLLDMQRLLARSGLLVQSFKSPTIGGVLEKLAADSLVLLHLQGGLFKSGHYIVLVKNDGDRTLIVDAASGLAWCPRSRLDLKFEPFMTGHFLVVTGAPAPDEAEPLVCRLDGTRVVTPVTTVRQEQGDVRIGVVVDNPSAEALRLGPVQGTCSCFRGASLAEGAVEIPAGAKATLEFVFDKEKLHVGYVEQLVTVNLEQPSGVSTPVIVRMNVVDPPGNERVGVFPKRLDFGRRSPTAVSAPVSLLLPVAARVASIEPSDPAIEVRLENEGRAEWRRDRGARDVRRYRVSLKEPKAGRFVGRVEFRLEGASVAALTVPVTMEAE